MSALEHAHEAHRLEEGSWAYVSLGEGEDDASRALRRTVVEACEASGWPAVSWSQSIEPDLDHSRFLDGVSHAVAHADVFIARLDRPSGIGEAELAFALQHRRPVIGIRVAAAGYEPSGVQAMLAGYDRARTIECGDQDDCASALREVLADQDFSTTIHDATLEHGRHA